MSVEGPPGGVDFVLLHGLTSVKRYVLMGSKLIQKAGMRVVSYDARGHGESDPAPTSSAYEYSDLVEDLNSVVELNQLSRPIGIGISMGAHTLLAAASEQPNLFGGLLLITPAFAPTVEMTSHAEQHWKDLADGLRSGGAEGFLSAGAVDEVGEKWRDLAARATLQRMAQHLHPDAVADALEVVPWSRPFEDWSQFSQLSCPTVVVGSRDEADPGHPLAVAQDWASQLPKARFEVEAEGESPLAWRGASISKLALDLAN